MKRIGLLLLALVAPLCWAAVTLPQASVTVQAADGSVRQFLAGDGSVRVEHIGGVDRWTMADFSFGGASFDSFTVDFKTDPFIAFNVGSTNITSAAVSFVFTFSTPFVGGPYNRVDAQLNADVFSQELDATLSGISLDSVVDGSARLTTTLPDCAQPPLDCGTASGSAGFSPATGGTGTLAAVLAFTVGVRDQAQVNGRTDLLLDGAAVPEPATPLLLALGAAGALLVQTRRLRPAQ